MLRQHRSPSSDGSGAKACRRPEAQSDDHAVSEGRGIVGGPISSYRGRYSSRWYHFPLLANIALSVIEERYERWVNHQQKRRAHRSAMG